MTSASKRTTSFFVKPVWHKEIALRPNFKSLKIAVAWSFDMELHEANAFSRMGYNMEHFEANGVAIISLLFLWE